MPPKKPRSQARGRNRTAGPRHQAPNRKPYTLTFKLQGEARQRVHPVRDLNAAKALVDLPRPKLISEMPIVRDQAGNPVAILSTPTF